MNNKYWTDKQNDMDNVDAEDFNKAFKLIDEDIKEIKNNHIYIQELIVDEAGFCSLPLESGSTSIYHLSNDPLMSNGIIHFVLPTPVVTDVFYQILIHANLNVNGGIFWGTSTFFNGEVPDIGTGTYDLIFEWDGENWCAGAIEKGVVE